MKTLSLFILMLLSTFSYSQAYHLYFGNANGDNVVTLDRVEENLPLAVEYELDLNNLERSFSKALDSMVQVILEDAELNELGQYAIHLDGLSTSYTIRQSSDPSFPFILHFKNRTVVAFSLTTALTVVRDDLWHNFKS